ncbi:unnamed protein product, partial [Rotaria sp. Silwood1]
PPLPIHTIHPNNINVHSGAYSSPGNL